MCHLLKKLEQNNEHKAVMINLHLFCVNFSILPKTLQHYEWNQVDLVMFTSKTIL